MCYMYRGIFFLCWVKVNIVDIFVAQSQWVAFSNEHASSKAPFHSLIRSAESLQKVCVRFCAVRGPSHFNTYEDMCSS